MLCDGLWRGLCGKELWLVLRYWSGFWLVISKKIDFSFLIIRIGILSIIVGSLEEDFFLVWDGSLVRFRYREFS